MFCTPVVARWLLEITVRQRWRAVVLYGHIANEIAQRQGTFAIPPDSTNVILWDALNTVPTKQWTRQNSAVFGPGAHTWDRQDTEDADALLAGIVLPQDGSLDELRAILTPVAGEAPIAHTIARMDRLRRVQGRPRFSSAQVTEFVRDIVRT